MSIEIISLVASAVASFIFKMYSNSQEDKQNQFRMAMELNKQNEKAVQSARKFQPNSYVRRYIALVFVTAFIYLMVYPDTLTYITEVEKPSYIFGLFGGGKEQVIKEVMGPLITKDFTQLVYIIIGYYFGSNLGNRK